MPTSTIRGSKKGLLRLPDEKSKRKERPRFSVAFSETVEFRTVYVTKQERLGQFYDLTHLDFIEEEGEDYTRNFITDFAATCIPLKDSDENNNSRKLKRLLWNYEDESRSNFSLSWLKSYSNGENSESTEFDEECTEEEFEDEYIGDFEYGRSDIVFDEYQSSFQNEKLQNDTYNYIESNEVGIKVE
ncbi:hypothetical protein FG386_001244 [Cryptosporidium ryanae]|uniref:uncharacterized protein n=1 Tax=Cryptosporidium ryanae TaxID=515981 RepID=UPI00351A6CA7|nr:hypothetical protein FG386_001244 [Cryptosporidium ryanae]